MADVVAEAKRALALSDEWWRVSDVWPTTSPPDGAYEDFSYEGVRDLVRVLVARVEQAEAIVAKGLDYEHHSSCGHVWTMRHTACPTCFSELKDRLQAAEAQVDYIHRQNDYLMERLQTAEAAYAEAQLTIAEALAFTDKLLAHYARFGGSEATDIEVAALEALVREVRRLQAEQGGPCTTCQHTYSSAFGEPTCAKLRRACVYMAGGCRAWKAKP